MLTLTLYRDNVLAAAEVRVDPTTVAGVAESFRVWAGTLVPVALVTQTKGQQFSVEDPAPLLHPQEGRLASAGGALLDQAGLLQPGRDRPQAGGRLGVPLSADVKSRVEALSPEDLAQLQLDLLQAPSLQELRLVD
jgi:hypothetical protein